MYANLPMLKKSFHLIPILPVYAIIITVTYSFTKYFLFDFFEISSKASLESGTFQNFIFQILKVFSILTFYICSPMVFICHLFAMFSNPGGNPFWEKHISGLKNVSEENYCKKCILLRPERAHHCKICDKCILKMDHHCPWIANCVGLKNLKYFFLFLFYATLGDFIAFICLLTNIFYIDLDAKINQNLNNSNISNSNKKPTSMDLLLYMKDPLICIIGAILAFFMTVSIGFLFVVQFLNLIKNKTTIEIKVYQDKESPYKYQNSMENFKSVMGHNILLWFVPVYYDDGKYNFKKEKQQMNYLSLSDIEDPNTGLNLQEI